MIQVVGHCPVCGAPIYGEPLLGEHPKVDYYGVMQAGWPSVLHACPCAAKTQARLDAETALLVARAEAVRRGCAGPGDGPGGTTLAATGSVG